MQKQSDQKPTYSAASIAVKILLMLLILPVVIPGYLLGWSMGAQSWMERLGFAEPTYSKYALCNGCGDVSADENQLCELIGECYGRIPSQDCKQQDLLIDGGDGRHKGKVTWSMCWGIDCDENWETGAPAQPQNTILSDVFFFVLVAIVTILIFVLPIALTIRLALGIFSAKIRIGIKAHPFLHILGAIFFTLLIIPFMFIGWIQIPADADVIENFYNNRSEFKQLAEMLLEDSHVRYISENLVLTCGSPEMEKFNRYQGLINQTALFGLRSDAGQSRKITFLRKDGYANAKFVKGYVYMNSDPSDMVASLDGGYRDLPAGSRLYKKIEENWYIYLEHQSNG
jgi:hypothetical protein